MSDEQAMKFFMITAFTLFVIVMVITLASNFMFTRKLNALGILLTDSKRIDEFIEENQKLLSSMKRQNLYRIALIKLNLSAGYCRKKDYQKSKEALEDIPSNAVKGANKAVYFINKSYTYFKLGMNDKAADTIREGQESIKLMEGHRVLGGNIAALMVLEACANENYEQAVMFYDIAKNKWSNILSKDDFDSLELAIKNIKNAPNKNSKKGKSE